MPFSQQNPSVTTPCLPQRSTTVTTTMTSRVRAPRIRLFITGFLQLVFGGFCLIPVLLLGPNPVTIAACSFLAFTGLIGILGSCVSSNQTSTSIKFDSSTSTQTVVTSPPIFPRFYLGLMIIGLLLGLASLIHGSYLITIHPYWYYNVILGPLSVGLGVFFVLLQMLNIFCICPMVRNQTSSAEQVHITASPPPTTGTLPGAYGAYAPQAAFPVASHVPAAGPSGSQLYPFIDDNVREDPPTYQEATQFDYQYPQKIPTAPEL